MDKDKDKDKHSVCKLQFILKTKSRKARGKAKEVRL
jgi:hypothetical protein